MNPADLLRKNHDIHLHSREFSDGWHTPQEIVAYALRRQAGERWLGISEHSPRPANFSEESGHTGFTAIQAPDANQAAPDWHLAAVDDLHNCLRSLQAARPGLEKSACARLLIGLELDWLSNGPLFSVEDLQGFDYLLASYHGRALARPSQAKDFLFKMVRHPLTDILAHADAFLGNCTVGNHAEMNGLWRDIFRSMAELGVLCEYNLTTPLAAQVFLIARDESDVQFAIGSDLHDFRRLSTRRIMEAWSESLGGGFELAYHYLLALIELGDRARDGRKWCRLFATPDALSRLEKKIYTRTRRFGAQEVPLSAAESTLVQFLDELPECAIDLKFQAERFRRFAKLPQERIATLLGADEFLECVRRGRDLRESHPEVSR